MQRYAWKPDGVPGEHTPHGKLSSSRGEGASSRAKTTRTRVILAPALLDDVDFGEIAEI
jgi:hypothetical protein